MTRLAELKSPTGKTYLTIDYDQHNNWIYNNWIGYATLENVKQGAMAVLDAFRKYPEVCCGLNDNRQLVGPWDQSVEWIEKEWMPLVAAAGLRYYAHIVDKESFAAASSKNMASRTTGHFTMRIFDNLKDAEKWLRQCQQAA